LIGPFQPVLKKLKQDGMYGGGFATKTSKCIERLALSALYLVLDSISSGTN